MKYLEISMKLRDEGEQPVSLIYERSIAVSDGLKFEDWQQPCVAKIQQASDEVAELLTDDLSREAKA